MIKTPNKLGIKGNFLNLIKDIYKKTHSFPILGIYLREIKAYVHTKAYI